MRKTFLTLLMLCSTMWSIAMKYDKPDFAFPQKVAEDAEKRYQKAVRINDGEALVDALIRWGLAKTSISTDYTDTLLARIDTVRAHETRPDIRCLLNILGNTICDQNYSFHGRCPLDYTEVDSLWQYPLTNYKHLIRAKKIDLMRVPTLADFLWSQDQSPDPIRTSDQELLPYLYQIQQNGRGNESLVAIYDKYESREESGEVLANTHAADSLMPRYQAYLKRYPKSLWKNDIKNKIAKIEKKEISLNCPNLVHSKDSLAVCIKGKNVSNVTLYIYAVPDKLYDDENQDWPVKEKALTLVKSYPVTLPLDTFRIAPLTYGRYLLQVVYTNDYGNRQKTSLEKEDIFVVTDMKQMVVSTSNQTEKFWVDLLDGHPIDVPATGDCYSPTSDTFRFRKYNDNLQKSAHFFTDLKIYRPGETVKYTFICYGNSIHERMLLTNMEVKVILNDAFSNEVGTLILKTDSLGQCAGEFVLPTDRANGTYSLSVKENKGNSYSVLGRHYFSVSEYKQPHFFVQMQCDKHTYKENDTLHITGHVENYTGARMAGYEVKMSTPTDTILRTDHKGDFTFSFVTGEEWNTSFNVSVTDEAGETQSASCYANRDWRTTPITEHEPTLKLRDLGIDGYHQAQIEVSVPWEAYIYYIACTRDSIVGQGWLHYDKAGQYLYLQEIPTQMDERVEVQFVTMHHGVFHKKGITVRDTLLQNRVHLSVETFRDKLFPGGKEQWRFHLSDAAGRPVQGRMLIEMYQQALEKMESNNWQWTVPFLNRTQYRLYCSNNYSLWIRDSWMRNPLKWLKNTDLELYQYNRNFGNVLYDLSTSKRQKRIRALANNAPMLETAKLADVYEIAEEESEIQIGYGGAKKQTTDFSSVAVRQMQTKVALWQPMLESDEEGNISITVDIPEDNTTWRMQALAFTEHLATDTLSRQLIVQRPIMVQPALPRFLRQGDETELKAMVQNTQSHAVVADVLVELFDPRTDKVLASKMLKIDIESNRQQAVSILCPKKITSSPMPFVGFRIKAKAEDCSDGEQQMLPLLDAAQPVIETTPFYLEPGEKDLTLKIPNDKYQMSTLELCSNPTWYAIQALPTVCSETGYSSPILAHQLYGLVLSEGIASANVKGMNPELAGQIRSSIEQWGKEKDSVLVSPLFKNEDLKIGTLKASPWLRTAERQTLRMQSLQKLFDVKHNADTKDEILKKLSALQNRDGGLSWIDYPDRKSSLYVTGEVLELLGELHQLGLSINWVGEDRALAYFDSMQIVILKEIEKRLDNRKKIDYSQWADYLYVRSLFDAPMPKENQKLMQKALDECEKDWRNWNLPIRAYMALALNRNGRTAEAKTIVASLKEFAYHDGARGTYWDNVSWMWCCRNKVSLNALILLALHEIAPDSAEEDGVRRWLLLNKQSDDWGDASMAAQVIYTLLSTGNDWLSGSELTYTRRELTQKEISSRKVKIQSMPNNPVWGALYVQSMQPMDSIKAFSIEDLKIQKEILGADSIGSRATIRITIDTRRDLEYVTVKDLRPACFEPTDRTSGYKWRLGAYCETKDAETNFFIQYLPKGRHTLTYDVYVTQSGTFCSGTATIQCQYAPQLTAHTEGAQIKL